MTLHRSSAWAGGATKPNMTSSVRVSAVSGSEATGRARKAEGMLRSTYRLSRRAAGMFGLALLGVLFATAGSARADIIFELGNNPKPDEQNILFGDGDDGNPIFGQVTLGVNTVSVGFASTTEGSLHQDAAGVADISTNDTDGLVNQISVFIQQGFVFGDLIINPQDGGGTATVTLH